MAWIGDDDDNVTEEEKQAAKRKALDNLRSTEGNGNNNYWPNTNSWPNNCDFSKLKLGNEVDDYANELIEEYDLKTLRDTKEIYYYEERRGIFVDGAETILEKRIDDDLGQPWFDKGKLHEPTLTTGEVNECLNRIRRRTYIDRDAFNTAIEWLACKNCMVNLLTGEVKEFGPDFMCTTQIPIIYDEHLGIGQITDFFRLAFEERGKIIKFLYQVVAAQDVETILDFMAYCLWRSYKFNFWLLFHGAGFNGKSILLTLIEKFFGKNNVSGETLDRLLHRDFAVGNLYNKMVNVDADVSADVIFNNTGIIKKMTGNDVHTGEFKYKNPFKFVNYAKLIFSCNRIPDTDDKTDAFFRRVLIINFTQQFYGDKENPNLIDDLCTDEEFTMLFQYELLPRLKRILRESGLRKTTNEGLAETYDKYTRGSDPVRYFYEKALAPSPGAQVPKMEVTEHFQKFCQELGLATESDQSFSRKLSDNHNLKSKQVRMNGERLYCWLDIRLVDWKKAEEERLKNLEEFGIKFSDEQKEVMR